MFRRVLSALVAPLMVLAVLILSPGQAAAGAQWNDTGAGDAEIVSVQASQLDETFGGWSRAYAGCGRYGQQCVYGAPRLTKPHVVQANMVWLDANTCDYANGWCAVYACSTRALASPVANIQEYFHGYYSSDYRGINDPASAECDRLVFWVDNQTDLIQIVVDCGQVNCYSVWVSRYW